MLEREAENCSKYLINTDSKCFSLNRKEQSIKILKLKLEICNEEENQLSTKLEKFKQEKMNIRKDLKYNGLKDTFSELGSDFINEIKEKYNQDFAENLFHVPNSNEVDGFLAVELDKEVETEDYLNEDNLFFDAYENEESILEDEAKEKKKLIDEINYLKKEIAVISSRKSTIRLGLVSSIFKLAFTD